MIINTLKLHIAATKSDSTRSLGVNKLNPLQIEPCLLILNCRIIHILKYQPYFWEGWGVSLLLLSYSFTLSDLLNNDQPVVELTVFCGNGWGGGSHAHMHVCVGGVPHSFVFQ